LKQTILFPFVTLGSLINFCDCLMSGGTSRKDHSEVGSSYIHFNYTPNQDKATPSLIGDVPNGVMLNRRPIFLGGQGGLVGPSRLAFGTVIAAGSIYRRDELRPDRMIFEGGRSGNIPFTPGLYLGVRRIAENNVIYIANLFALMQWYRHIRPLFVSEEFPDALLDGLKEKLASAVEERVRWLKTFCERQEDRLSVRWHEAEQFFGVKQDYEGDTRLRDIFSEKVRQAIPESGKDCISVIKGIPRRDTEVGTWWLQGIVDHVSTEILKIL